MCIQRDTEDMLCATASFYFHIVAAVGSDALASPHLSVRYDFPVNKR